MNGYIKFLPIIKDNNSTQTSGVIQMNMTKKLSILIASLVLMLAFAFSAMATITIQEVELDDDTLSASSTNTVRALDRGDEVPIKVKLTSNVDADNVQVEISIRGYDHNDMIDDITNTFNMKKNVTYVKKLSLPIRDRMDQDKYKLRVRVEDRDSNTVQETYELEIEAARHSLSIRDIVLNPENEVKAGRALLASVRVLNTGQKNQKDVKVQVSIPELGVSATSYLDEIEKEDSNDDAKTSEEMFLRIPADANSGVYTLRAEVTYDEGDEKAVKEMKVRVLAEGSEVMKEDKTIITLVTDTMSANTGSEASFPLTITNAGATSKTYTLLVDGASWATYRVNPTNMLVVEAGESKAVTINAAVAGNAASGIQTFMVTVMGDAKVLKQIPMKVNVAGGAAAKDGSLKKALEVGVIVLLILFVVIGLILGFTRRKEDNGSEDKSYY